MSTTERIETRVFGEVSFDVSRPWSAYWLVFLRVVTGYWFFHAGLSKLVESGLFYDTAWWTTGTAKGTIVGPITTWFGTNLPWLVDFMIPVGETLIGLGLLVGALTRVAAFFGVTLMFFFYFGNMEFAHGWVNGNLFGLLLFVTVIVFGAGRVYGLDAVIERTRTVRNNPWLRYFLG